MKKSWQAIMLIAALSILFCFNSAPAQTVPIAGGYADTSNTAPEVVSAARFAIRTQALKQGARITLVSIERAEMQVVAGLNYRLHLRVKVNGQSQDAEAVVYRNLKNNYSLTSWETKGGDAGGASASSNPTIEQLVKALADAYNEKDLGRMDAARPLSGRVRIVIENSLAEDGSKDQYERRSFNSLSKAEQWLKSREREDNAPFRYVMPLIGCKKGSCTYDFDSGILHNHLYIKEISYGYSRGRPYIKSIHLLDGD